MNEPPRAVDGPMGLLLCRDLLFTSKVTGEARAQGTRVLVAGDSALACSLIEQWRPKVLFLDLAADELTRPAAILAYRQITGPDVPFIAFGSHVDTAALASARDAGCDVVLPRSKFTTDLPGLIRHHLTGESTLG